MHKSDYYASKCRTPQASVLGPLLFFIFVNDLHLNIYNSDCILFADELLFLKLIPT